MRYVLITGSNGFIGKNLQVVLGRKKGISILTFNRTDNDDKLQEYLIKADVIYHLAGVNRPDKIEEFEVVNNGLTRKIIEIIKDNKKQPLIVMPSSTQASFDSPYGMSKRKAEEALLNYSLQSGGLVYIFRLPGVFGKWCKPNYNSVVATFCYNIAHKLPIMISDPFKEIELVYIGDVISSFLTLMDDNQNIPSNIFLKVEPIFRVTLRDLANTIKSFSEMRNNLLVPDLTDKFSRYLYATYLSYLDPKELSYDLKQLSDQRGSLAEIIKSQHFGQIFISRTQPGITRGKHYHDTKVEKFCVLHGEAIIRFKNIFHNEVITYRVSGKDWKVLDIPPGYIHSIENVGSNEMIVLFWADKIFDPNLSDTYPCEVRDEEA
jgi:UDP-2-acetamido-2,6-beta-L-arabino-hexul-4-ose reductase